MGKLTISMAIFNSYVKLPPEVIFLGNKCWDWVLDSGWEDVELLYLRLWRAVHGRVIVGKKMHVLYVVIFRESE